VLTIEMHWTVQCLWLILEAHFLFTVRALAARNCSALQAQTVGSCVCRSATHQDTFLIKAIPAFLMVDYLALLVGPLG
jgi:hypothetical protein